MTGTTPLRTAIIGLLGFANTEEEILLTSLSECTPEEGSPARWAAVPLVAHNTEFKHQQVQRLEAIRRHETPPSFGDIDHSSANTYAAYAAQSSEHVAERCRRITAELIAGVRGVADDDLLDPTRNPWLAGRPLGLQIVVRGFWHPTGHLAEYYLAHSQPERAVAMQAQAVATSGYLKAPPAVYGMAYYNLACSQSRAGLLDEALASISSAVELNPDLGGKVARDTDLSAVRESGRLEALRSAWAV